MQKFYFHRKCSYFNNSSSLRYDHLSMYWLVIKEGIAKKDFICSDDSCNDFILVGEKCIVLYSSKKKGHFKNYKSKIKEDIWTQK